MEYKIDELEKLASNEAPSIEGASWITLQVIEHCFNTISNKDNISRKEIPSLLSEYLERFNQINQENSIRPLPNDILLELVEYSKDALEEIFRDTKNKLIKQDKMIKPHQLKNITNKTMNWLGKQSGRNIKEKLATKNKILSQVSKYSFNTNENQIVKRYCIMMEKFLKSRIKNGINKDSYDCNEKDGEIFDKIELFLEIISEIKNNNLSEIKPSVKVQANNILLNDRRYLKIWKSINELIKYEHKIKEDFKYILERFTYLLFVNIGSNLIKLESVTLIDNAIKKVDESGKIDFENLNNNVKFLVENDFSTFTKGKIIFIEKEKKFGFVKAVDNKQYFFNENSLKNKDCFEELKKNDIIFFNHKESFDKNKEDVITDIFLKNKYCLINNFIEDNKINIELFELSEKNFTYEKKCIKKLIYELKYNKELRLKNKRGINFIVDKYEAEKINSKYKFEGYADIKGLKSISKMIIDELISLIGISTNECNRQLINEGINNVSIDFSANDFKIYSNTKLVENDKLICCGNFINENLYCVTQNRSVKIPIDYKNIAVSDIFELNNFKATRLFENSIKNIDNLIDDNEMVLYNVPDNIDEFSQKNIKTIMKLNTNSSYPIWKSINAGYYFINKNQVNIEEKILIMDTNGNEAYTTQLKILKKSVDNEYILEHYAPFAIEESENEINVKYFEKQYLEMFLKKYKIDLADDIIENILKKGLISKILLNKIESMEYINEQESFIKFFYDSEIYKKDYEVFLENFKEYSNSIIKEIGNIKYNYVLLIGNHLTENPKLKESLSGIKGLKEFKIISDKMLFQGSNIIRERIKNNKITWYEYLPNLSLEVIKNGHFGELELINNKSVENIMGNEEIIKIQETLLLSKEHKYYDFPLIKASTGKNNIELNVKITSESFPLNYDLEVELAVKYKYGYENSYELIVNPKNNIEKVIIKTEWIEENIIKNVKNIYPSFPKTSYSKENINSWMGQIERVLEKHYKKLSNFSNLTEERIKVIGYELFEKFKKINKIIAEEFDDIKVFIERIYSSDALKFYGEIIGVKNYNFLSDDFKNNQNVKRLKNTFGQFLCRFGKFTLPSIKKYYIEKYDEYDKSVFLCSLLIGNSLDSEVLSAIIKIGSNINLIRSLSSTVWVDKEIILNLYIFEKEYIKRIIKVIEIELKNIFNKFNKGDILKYRDLAETLLAILRLREKEDFISLKAGNKESLLLAKYIKKIDYKIFESEEKLKSRIKFNLDKPDSLKNMSDLSYVLYVYLTGEEGVNLPEIAEIEDE